MMCERLSVFLCFLGEKSVLSSMPSEHHLFPNTDFIVEACNLSADSPRLDESKGRSVHVITDMQHLIHQN